jgi:hypothetical protein
MIYLVEELANKQALDRLRSVGWGGDFEQGEVF